MAYDQDRAAEFVLALMYLDIHDYDRAWKGYPWDVLDVLHERGLISDPEHKAKSVVLTDEGLVGAPDAFETLLALNNAAPDKSRPAASTAPSTAPSTAASSRLSELQVALAERLLRPICAPNSDPAVAAQLRHGYRFDGYSVILFESRPAFRAPHMWHDRDVAKFRFVKTRGVWELFCQFRDLKWRAYEPFPQSPDLALLVAEVHKDPTGIFWGLIGFVA